MNSSKISLPSPQFIEAYIWFIHFTSFLSWITVPFLFYTILTQSKGLKSYKNFILNHSFWSLMFETMLGLFTPMLLLPAFGGFPLTILRDSGSIHFTSTATFIGFIFGINYIASLFVTIGTRYMATFSQSSTQQKTKKSLIIFCIVSVAILYPPIIYGATTVYDDDANFVHTNAMAYDAEFFANFSEPSMIFFLIKPYKILLYAALAILIIGFVAGLITIAVFIYLVRANTSASVTKVQKSLIISSVVQILLTLLFLILPIIFILLIVLLEIPNSSIYGCICISFISAHSFLEFVATLYFVLPYRKFVQKQLTKIHILKTVQSSSSTLPSSSSKKTSIISIKIL